MNKRTICILTVAAAALACLFVGAFAQSNAPNYQLLTKIEVPGGLAGFDISWVDASTQRYYLADRTATPGTGRIDVVDTQAMTLLGTIPGLQGPCQTQRRDAASAARMEWWPFLNCTSFTWAMAIAP